MITSSLDLPLRVFFWGGGVGALDGAGAGDPSTDGGRGNTCGGGAGNGDVGWEGIGWGEAGGGVSFLDIYVNTIRIAAHLIEKHTCLVLTMMTHASSLEEHSQMHGHGLHHHHHLQLAVSFSSSHHQPEHLLDGHA